MIQKVEIKIRFVPKKGGALIRGEALIKGNMIMQFFKALFSNMYLSIYYIFRTAAPDKCLTRSFIIALNYLFRMIVAIYS